MTSDKGRPRLLDLYCKAGGASVGYDRAGFEVTGVDMEKQRRYPFKFVRDDAVDYLMAHWHEFDAVHASPPCQAFTSMRRCHSKDPKGGDLIEQTREALQQSGLPWVIENVPGAPLESPALICGFSLGLRVLRHRLFETNWFLMVPPHRTHPRGSYWGDKPRSDNLPSKQEIAEAPYIPYRGHAIDAYQEALGVPWMSRREAREAIPPAYTELVGKQLINQLEV